MTTNLYPDLEAAPAGELVPVRVLAIGAHPDDIEFGCGGSLAKWAARGARITMVIVTDGSKGTWDRSIDPDDLAATRRAEQEAAAGRLGAEQVVMLEHIDGELEYSMALRAEMCLQIRRHRPDVLLSHDPWQRYQLHPDHRATGMAAVDGMVAARDHLFFPDQGLEAHRPASMLLWSADTPDHREDITQWFDDKVGALLEHSSQSTTTMGDAASRDDARAVFVDRLKAMAARAAEGTSFELGEAFKRLAP